MAISDVFKEKSKNARSSRKRSTTSRHRAHEIERERRIAAAIFTIFFFKQSFKVSNHGQLSRVLMETS